MAEEHKEVGDPLHNLYFFIALMVLLVVLWFAAGGPSRADLGGILLHAPAPLDTGGAYGPNPQPQFEGGTVPPPQGAPQYQY